jgi:DNA-binding CsgD family transcriptional regulator
VKYVTGLLRSYCDTDGWVHALPTARATVPLVAEVADPLTRTGFWFLFTNALIDAGLPDEARDALRELRADASTHGLRFVEPRALLQHAAIDLLLRRFHRAALHVRHAVALAPGNPNVLTCAANIDIARALTQQPRAVRQIPPLRPPDVSFVSEHLSWQALYEAARSDDPAAWGTLAQNALARMPGPFTRNLVACARAIALRHDADAATDARAAAARACLTSGDVYTFATAYRIESAILRAALADGDLNALAMEVARRLDPDLLDAIGVARPHEPEREVDNPLSPREREVLALLSDGLTNREIAQRLFIAEATAKLHVRRICRKLGVRSRTEAVLAAIG